MSPPCRDGRGWPVGIDIGTKCKLESTLELRASLPRLMVSSCQSHRARYYQDKERRIEQRRQTLFPKFAQRFRRRQRSSNPVAAPVCGSSLPTSQPCYGFTKAAFVDGCELSTSTDSLPCAKLSDGGQGVGAPLPRRSRW
eukprot:2320960-Pleurochrysis_carterae.AAC.3